MHVLNCAKWFLIRNILTVAKAASVFVLYATSCANNVASNSHRKTLNGSDVIKAMEDMEFHKFIDPLESSLESKFYNDIIALGMAVI